MYIIEVYWIESVCVYILIWLIYVNHISTLWHGTVTSIVSGPGHFWAYIGTWCDATMATSRRSTQAQGKAQNQRWSQLCKGDVISFPSSFSMHSFHAFQMCLQEFLKIKQRGRGVKWKCITSHGVTISTSCPAKSCFWLVPLRLGQLRSFRKSRELLRTFATRSNMVLLMEDFQQQLVCTSTAGFHPPPVQS